MKWLSRILALFAGLGAILFVATFALLPAKAQTIKATIPLSISITTGLTYQQVVAGGGKNSLTIQNNNAADSCWLIVGGPFLAGDTTATSRSVNGVSITALKASILLLPGGSYTRYQPYIPGDTVLGTCTTTGDSIYADTQ